MRYSRSAVPFVVAAVCAACEVVPQPGLGPNARRELDRAERAAITWITQTRGARPVEEEIAVAVGYLERLRLGFGSPFRLTEYALNDHRLSDTTRARVAWAILARTLSGDAYEIDPVALDRIGLRGQVPVPGSGRLHLDLIDSAIRESADPRGAELAVRLGYMLAAAAGDLNRGAPELAGRAAALIRDRELARADVDRLLRAAADSGRNALVLLPRWRAERRFDVERPAMEPVSVESERTAMEVAPRLARVLGLLATEARDSRKPLITRMHAPRPLLGARAAAALASSADSLQLPPATPVAIASMLHQRELIDAPWLLEAERDARTRFLERAVNEESFAATYATLSARSPRDAGPASVALSAAVALRAWAQEPVWLPGNTGPSIRELQERWDLASFEFDYDVPAAWRPYYRRMVDIALTDMSRVLPSLDLRGLSVLVTNGSQPDATLAMHDPRRRQLVLPTLTSAGTLAHEIAHDLDWQVALERYRVRGDYGSDRAVRTAGDRLAERLQDMTSAFMDSRPGDRIAHRDRPAEVFARNVDFFVAVSLAAQGRSNGYLSSVQDDLLTGYGSVRPPDITGTAGQALVTILDDVAPLYPSTREWFVSRYGIARSMTPYDLVRRMLETGSRQRASGSPYAAQVMAGLRPGEDRFRDIEQARDAGFAAIDAWVCRAPGASYYREDEMARRRLVLVAAKARATGEALDLARRLGGRRAETWLAHRLKGEPGPFADEPDAAMRTVLDQLFERVMKAGEANLPEPVARIEFMQPAAHCSASPLPMTGSF